MIGDLKEIYSRRTKKEKILTVGVMVAMVLVMLLVTARTMYMAMPPTPASEVVSILLFELVAGDVEIYALATFIVGILPLIVMSAAVIDEISQTRTEFALPFYFYLLLFFVEKQFYDPMAYTAVTWLSLLVFSFLLFALVKRRRDKMVYVFLAALVVLLLIELGRPVLAMLPYLICMVVNTGMSYVMNRASVLKKKYWYGVMLILYLLLFGLGRLG